MKYLVNLDEKFWNIFYDLERISLEVGVEEAEHTVEGSSGRVVDGLVPDVAPEEEDHLN